MSTMVGPPKRLKLTFILFLLLNMVAFNGYSKSPQPGGNQVRVKLQLKWKHQFQFAGYYAALEKGFYHEAGLDVEIKEAEDGEESTSQVIDGKADFGVAMSDLIELRAKGKPVVALASIFQHSPLIILTPKKSGIENVHDLLGKRISLESHSEQILSYLDSEGLPTHKLVIYPHDYDTSKLISGEIDAMSAYSTDEPFMLLSKGIEYSIFSPRAGGIDFYGDTLFTSENQINEHPERVSAFLGASLKGWQYALDQSEEIIDLILAKYTTRHSREHLFFEAEKSKRLIMADVVELGYMNPGRWLHIADSFKKLNRIPNDFTLEGFIYDRNPAPDLRWLYLSILGALLIAGIAFFLVSRFYKLNQLLKKEICEREKTDALIKASLNEKETLLHEIHHRVKNNMAVITGLLELQMNSIDNKMAKEALQDSQNRVQSMSMIHETLFRSDSLTAIDLKTHLLELGRTIIQNYSINRKVQYKVEADNVTISVKQATPIGLIVNELITNSLKYAFSDDREGVIVLKLKSNSEKGVELSVSDNGVGIPEGFNLQDADSLGLKLAKMLAENQLGGSIYMESNNGTKFTIKFNLDSDYKS